MVHPHLSGLLKSLLPRKEQAIRSWQSTKLNFNILIKDSLWVFNLCAFFGGVMPHGLTDLSTPAGG